MSSQDRFDIKVSFARLKTSISALALKSSVKTYNLKSTFSDLTLKAYTELNSLRATIEIGKFPFLPILVELTDLATTTTNNFYTFIKTLNDSVSAQSEDVTFNVTLNKEETGIVLENISLRTEKTFQNFYAASESIVLEPIKVIFDSVQFQLDETTLDTIKGLNDSAILEESTKLVIEVEKNLFSTLFATDDVDGAASIDDDQEIFFTKQKQDLYYALDAPFIVTQKPLLNNATASDDTKFIEVIKAKDDLATAIENTAIELSKLLTDENTSIDLLSKTLVKSFEEFPEALESIQKELVKGFLNTGEVLENSFLTATKNLNNFLDALENVSFSTLKTIQDTPLASEEISLSLDKPLQDTYSAFENAQIAVAKSFFDESIFTENSTIAFIKNENDFSTVSEDYSPLFVKVLKSIVGVTDDLDGETSILDDQEIIFTKALTNISSLSDNQFRVIQKALQDSFVSLENLSFELTRNVSDLYNSSDTLFLDIAKASSDSAQTTDIENFIFSKFSNDIATTQDNDKIVFGKNAQDIAALNDENYFLTTEKQLFTSLTVTDDVDGEASILDDQEILFTKQRTNVIFSLDTINFFNVEKGLLDQSFAIDNTATTLEKSLFSSIDVLDEYSDFFTTGLTPENQSVIDEELTLLVQKNLTDSYNAFENAFITNGKSVTDSFTGVEQKALTLIKAVTDTSIAVEISTIAFNKALFDNTDLTDDTISFSTTKALFDNLFVTDDVDGEASILDDQEIFFTKSKTDIAFASENSFRNITKALANTASVNDIVNILLIFGRTPEDFLDVLETASLHITQSKEDTYSASDQDTLTNALFKTETSTTSSSGSLISQGYTVDNTYFLEDYVGSSRLFT
jgi:hypothetical protein